jgi:hypothetical protein
MSLPDCTKRFCGSLSLLVGSALLLGAAPAVPDGKDKAPKTERKAWKNDKSSLLQSDFPYTTACIGAKFPGVNNANKGMAIILGNDAFLCFDIDLLRVSAGWTGGYITTKGVTFDGAHGGHPDLAGDQQFGTRPLPGWTGADGKFTDSRPEPYGPLPRSQGRFDGAYVVGENVVLAYTVFGTRVYEQPGSVAADGLTGFVRTFRTDQVKAEMSAVLCEVDGATGRVNGAVAELAQGDTVTVVGLAGAPRGCTLAIADGNRVVLKFAQGTPAGLFKVVIWKGARADEGKFTALIAGKPAMVDFAKGGPARWPEPVVTKGALAANGTPDGAYVVDQLTPPVENPWKRRVRFGGFDFFADGKRAALCTWDGDVWIVSGIDDKLENLTWRRFASGGFETLGLKIVNDVIYTSGRCGITRYRDLNHDGEADYYENFNYDLTSSPGFHEFVFDLQGDKAGNFYFAKAGPVKGGGRGFGGGGGNGEVTAHAGTLMRVNQDGSKLDVYATGFRAPNGIGVSPDGQVTTGDNEGTWVAQCPLNWVKPGGFYGVKDLAHTGNVPERDQPLLWFPKNDWDNSGGGQAWVTSDKWGPYSGEMLHLSYGQCALFHISKEIVKGRMQGAAVKIPVALTSSAMRARFNPKDGQLYIAGLQGWQTKAAKITGLDRIRYTGKPVQSVAQVRVKKDAVQFIFTQPLDPASATDTQNYSMQHWNIETRFVDDKVKDGLVVRAANFNELNYGGHEVSPNDPLKLGREDVEIRSAKLSSDGRTVTLEIPGLKPVHQMLTKFAVNAKDGTPIKQEVLQTINAVP